jgi:WD40 repeat protein
MRLKLNRRTDQGSKMSQPIRYLVIRVAIFLIFGIGFLRLAQNPVMRSYLVHWSDLDQITPKIYVDPEMPEADRGFLLAAVAEGETRITTLYGDCQATPIIIAGHTMDVMSRFGGNTYNRVGRTYLTALGQYIILGPDGSSNLDVITHEIAHSELAQRIGYKTVSALPDWFEEGLALQVDERFTEEAWKARTSGGIFAPDLDEIGTIAHDDWLAYVTAKHEVSRWLNVVGQEGLLAFLQTIQQNGDFYSAYEMVEDQSLANQLSVTVELIPTLPPSPMQLHLPNLQPITTANAADIQSLEKHKIPGFKFVRETCSVAFSPGGAYLATACMSKKVPVWNMVSGELLYLLELDHVGVGVTFSPDGKILITTSEGATITFWDMQTGEAFETFTSETEYLNIPAMSPDGEKLLVGSFAGVAIVWELESDQVITTFEAHHSRVNSVAFSPNSTLAISGGGDNRALVWDAETGEVAFELTGARYFIEDVQFSPDGQFVVGASDDSVIRIWSMEDGQLTHTLFGHNGPVNGIAYHPDGSMIASCGNDKTLRLWDVSSGKRIAIFTGHTDYAIRPAFNPQGTLIATIGWDGVLAIWGIPSE